MEELKLWVSICSTILTSFISLITIYVNIRLSRVNINNSNRIKQYDQHKAALIKYYLPIKYNLIELEYLLLEGKDYFDMFSLYNHDIQKAKKREIIINAYAEFIDRFHSLPLYFTNNEIDKQISEVYEHVSIILLGEKNGVSITEYKEKYKLPKLQNIICLIDNYAEKYETYNRKTLWTKIKSFFENL